MGPVHQGHQPGETRTMTVGICSSLGRTIVEASSLPSHWSAQQAELCALIRALQLSKGKKTNTYTDSRYAFAILHVHRALYNERGLLTASKKKILKIRRKLRPY